ncbi:hypothetical protein G6F56_007435 [Rhizopus delemar]|uniref:Uncharacterized protein n=1 Tax=Rhizopus stolonifer TaxID=4846 RepID=A0A367KJI7_RHIST|nr:hypothetical protein G6F56_007435 [Rhizopus delemar]RCI02329.1 hypothetical protein CU098_010420 [Rhizopus stolonifer]
MAVKKKDKSAGCAKIDSYYKKIPNQVKTNNVSKNADKNDKSEKDKNQQASSKEEKETTKKPFGLKSNGDKVIEKKRPLDLTLTNNSTRPASFSVFCDEDKTQAVKRKAEDESEIDTQNIGEGSCSQITVSSPIEYIESQDEGFSLYRTNENSASQMATPRPARKDKSKGILTDKTTGKATPLYPSTHATQSQKPKPVEIFQVYRDPTISNQGSEDEDEVGKVLDDFFEYEEEAEESQESDNDDFSVFN